jgi:hypothetical protein
LICRLIREHLESVHFHSQRGLFVGDENRLRK